MSVSTALPYRRWRRHDDDDEIAYFTVGWKTRELVLSTTSKTRDNTDKDSKTENGPISRGSQSDVSMVRDLWGGGRFIKKVSFEFRVKEWRGDGWGEWRIEGWIEVSIKRWNWFTKWKWKLIPEMSRGILKRALLPILDFVLICFYRCCLTKLL